MSRGFLPCFSHYLNREYPLEDVYSQNSYVTKAKNLLSALFDIENPYNLTRDCGVGKEIQPIRPDSAEGKRLVSQCCFPFGNLYRIDYGDNPFRIIFGTTNSDRRAYIFGFDTKHKSFSDKHRK